MRVDWCVSSWFRIKNTHSRRLGPGVGVRFGWVAAQGAGFAFCVLLASGSLRVHHKT